jgi:glycosyltransferase involved in cell wall biosynthesis
MKKIIIRTSTIPDSLNVLLKGQLNFLNNQKEFEIIAVSGKGNSLEEVSKRERVKIIAVDIKREISVLNDLISLFKLWVLFRTEKPIMVHSITPKAGLLSMLAANFANVPLRLHTFTGLVFPSKTGFLKKILILMDKILCLCATNVYPEGQGVKADLITYKITSKPLKVIANGNINGIDTDYFNKSLIHFNLLADLKIKLKIKKTDFVFIFVGRLVKDKGINELIEAFVKLQNLDVKLLLVGDYEHELDPLLESTLNEISNNSNIISVGFQKDVRPYFAISNCLVFPSYREGFPNVVMQAGAMELPSIVTDINGCNEIIEEGINGTIIPVKDPKSLFESMLKIVNNESWRNQLISNSRYKIVSRYEQKLVWEAILTEYKKLLIEKKIKNV